MGVATTLGILSMTGLLSFGGLKGCSSVFGPKYKVGDCVESAEKESWEKFNYLNTFRINRIGEKYYQVAYYYAYRDRLNYVNWEMYLIDSSYLYKQIECPDTLK